jgi:polyphosphate kinase 2 (PPK2 family)
MHYIQLKDDPIVTRMRVPVGKKVSLKKDFDAGYHLDLSKEECKAQLEEGIATLATLQDILYAHNIYAVLCVFQAMDAAGKDGTIKHVMSGVNPQGVRCSILRRPRWKNSTMTTCGVAFGPFPNVAASEFLTVPTMRKCW